MSKIDDIVGRILEGRSDYYVANQRGYKGPMDAYNDNDMFLYYNLLLQDMQKKGKMKMGKWKAFEEDMMGTWAWTQDDEEFVYITPYFEGEEMVSADWTDTEGNYKSGLFKKKLVASGDPKKDFDNYMSLVKQALSKVK